MAPATKEVVIVDWRTKLTSDSTGEQLLTELYERILDEGGIQGRKRSGNKFAGRENTQGWVELCECTQVRRNTRKQRIPRGISQNR